MQAGEQRERLTPLVRSLVLLGALLGLVIVIILVAPRTSEEPQPAAPDGRFLTVHAVEGLGGQYWDADSGDPVGNLELSAGRYRISRADFSGCGPGDVVRLKQGDESGVELTQPDVGSSAGVVVELGEGTYQLDAGEVADACSWSVVIAARASGG